MVKDMLGAVGSVSALASKVWTYFTGDRTRAQISLEAEAEAALEAAKNAQSVAELNAAYDELQRVYDQAVASKREP